MIDIQVKNLTKFFVIGENLLDGLSFEIQEGECVAILGRNGCGKTTLFNILTGQMDFDDGEVYVNPHKKLGLISQIPRFPAGFTVEDVLRSAYKDVLSVKEKMEALETAMSQGATPEQLREYDALSNRFRRAVAAAGLPPIRFHDLRHYSASILHAIGVPDQYILARGGWASDYVMKSVYRNSISEEARKQDARIAAHFATMQPTVQPMAVNGCSPGEIDFPTGETKE